ncbi:TadE family type IV pilus minor pilin [Arthrobacter cryoconiti]|uniref:TadE family type IV pilus minor pilin n=1 Tax=Arthrobacter cryoconiti TaxID=748907 RepID=A0ABV8R2J9_9MICC|nr:TadE family type IV pilus minor pilin [Arthrobacter cryoconiti]MCC9068056.1 hypothetical protein [Arthrobacter cryoconiti]
MKTKRSTSKQSLSVAAARVRGSVTAEFAVLLPAVTVLLAIFLFAAAAGILQLRLEEGARAGARALARGESTEQAIGTANHVSGGDVVVTVDLVDGFAAVTLTGRVSGVLSALLPWPQTARAIAKIENYASTAQSDAKQPGTITAKTGLWRWVNSSNEEVDAADLFGAISCDRLAGYLWTAEPDLVVVRLK